MRILLFFILLSTSAFTQDTIFFGKDFVVKENGLVMEKSFRSSKNWIRIVYQYDSNGILIRRYWYSREGKIIGVSFDN
jgi:hypothetical protein